MEEIIVSLHAKERVKSRLGIKGSQIEKEAFHAYNKGKDVDNFCPKNQKYLRNILAYSSGNILKIWRNSIFIFGDNTLITAYTLPPYFAIEEKRGR